MLELIKARCGIARQITVYDSEIRSYIEDCKKDMEASGVPARLIQNQDERVITAATCFVKAYLGNDRSDTDKYLELYRQRVFRLTLEEGGT